MNQNVIDWEQMEIAEMERLARLERDDSHKRWAKYPRPNPFSYAYGFGSTLYKLKGDMDNHQLTPITRRQAAKALYKIQRDIQDKTLMGLRERLIRASIAEDESAINSITKEMRAYAYQDQETGLYD